MAQKPTIPSQYLPQPCGTNPRITIFTNSTDFLYLLFTFTRPKRKPRYKTIRGLRYECGRAWEYEDAICIPQTNTPTQNYHIFALPSAAIGTCGYYSISNACRFQEATSFSPPIQYCYVDCPPGGSFIQEQRAPVTLLGSSYALGYRDVIAGNAACRINDLSISPLTDFDYNFTATAVVRADPNANGTWTGEMYFRRSDGEEFGHTGPWTTDRGQEITISCSANFWVDAVQSVTVNVRRTAGTNLLQMPTSLNAFAQYAMTPL